MDRLRVVNSLKKFRKGRYTLFIKFILSGASMLKTIFGKPAKEYLGEHFKDIHEVRSDRFLKTNKKVKFEDFNVEGIVQDDKYLLAKQLIQREGARKILIFCQQGEEAIEIAKFLSSEGIPSEAFHAK